MNQQSLNCISANGPATDVIWERNGKELDIDNVKYSQLQQVISTSESMYINSLHVRNLDPVDVVGNYTCIVNNSRGYANQYFQIKGIYSYIVHDVIVHWTQV